VLVKYIFMSCEGDRQENPAETIIFHPPTHTYRAEVLSEALHTGTRGGYD